MFSERASSCADGVVQNLTGNERLELAGDLLAPAVGGGDVVKELGPGITGKEGGFWRDTLKK